MFHTLISNSDPVTCLICLKQKTQRERGKYGTGNRLKSWNLGLFATKYPLLTLRSATLAPESCVAQQYQEVGDIHAHQSLPRGALGG